MKRARFVAAARYELIAEIGYYDREQFGLAAKFVSALDEATQRALEFPWSGSPFAAGTRRVLLKGFPYSLIYRPSADGILVFALMHHARHPDYWRTRIQDR